MTESIAGRVVIITGAAGGIGAALARHLAGREARLVLQDRAEEPLRALAEELGALAHPSDVTSEADMADMARSAQDQFGRIDALVTAAAILRAGGTLKPLAETSFAEWRQVIDVNLTGTFLAARAVLPAMLAQRQGDIVAISSVSGRQGRAFDGPYSASKFGIIGLAESLAEEVARDGVRVQSLLPDAVDTPIWDQSGMAALKPRNLLSPERVAEVIHYLLTLPRDAFFLNSVLAPSPTRGRRGKG